MSTTEKTKETAETWTNILPVRDWEAIERAWSDIYSSVNPGEVNGVRF